ncbi:MAG: carbohydrate-binding domain-containing protein [Bacteroidales bacterium]|nr:carbohydrate-binding domain-containing protein [Bacteroidales bacterium]
MTNLADGTYYVGADITFTNTINCLTVNGSVTIILCNGKTMTLPSNEKGIYSYGSITIYGQSLDPSTAGTLIYDGTSYAIQLSTYYTQHSGNVSINSSYGIDAMGVTLNGGTLTINVSGDDLHSTAIQSGMGGITINGGQLDATSSGYCLYSRGSNITLGWTNSTDYIHASSYDGPVNIASGQVFVTNDPRLTRSLATTSTLAASTARLSGPY